MIEKVVNYNTKIEELDLTVKTYNFLKRTGINTLGDFKKMIHSKEDLLKIRNFSLINMKEIINKLIECNIIELTSSGEIKYISEESLFKSVFGYQNMQEINQDKEDYKKSVTKKFERLIELNILLKKQEKLMQIDRQLDDEIALLMSQLSGDDKSAKRK